MENRKKIVKGKQVAIRYQHSNQLGSLTIVSLLKRRIFNGKTQLERTNKFKWYCVGVCLCLCDPNNAKSSFHHIFHYLLFFFQKVLLKTLWRPIKSEPLWIEHVVRSTDNFLRIECIFVITSILLIKTNDNFIFQKN